MARATDKLFFKTNRSRSDPIFHNSTEPSLAAEAIVVSSLPKASAVTVAALRRNVCLSVHVFVSQLITSVLAAETSTPPDLLNVNTLNGAVCLFSVFMSLPVFRSQILIVLSALPDASQRPSGLKASATIGPSCFCRLYSSCPESTSQTLIVKSLLPDAI